MSVNRYIRQTSLKDFGEKAQQKLGSAKVLVIGAGGLGIPVLQYLSSMGVGTLGVVENDNVDITNLQRQVIFSENDVGNPKIYSVINKLKDLNSEVKLLPFKTFLTPENAVKILSYFDLIVDCSDNFPTRYLVNDACVILKKPFIYGALHGFEGQISVFNYKDGPTYRCLYPNMPEPSEIPDCNENGVLGVIPGIIGTLQALEAVKVIAEIGEVISGKLLLYDGLQQEFTNMFFKTIPENKNIVQLQDSYGLLLCNKENSISIEEFQLNMKLKKPGAIIDVRTQKEFDAGHLPNAINIPVQNISASFNYLKTIDHKTIYLICQSGARSTQAQRILQEQFPDLIFRNILGGYNAMDENIINLQDS